MLSLEKNIPNQEVQIRPIKQIITTIIISTQPPASSKEISAFFPAKQGICAFSSHSNLHSADILLAAQLVIKGVKNLFD